MGVLLVASLAMFFAMMSSAIALQVHHSANRCGHSTVQYTPPSTLATRGEWGTSLDVHSIEHFANPFVKRTVSVEPGSQEQLMWLVWSGHLLILPALYMMSAGGVALARIIVAKGAVQAPPPATD